MGQPEPGLRPADAIACRQRLPRGRRADRNGRCRRRPARQRDRRHVRRKRGSGRRTQRHGFGAGSALRTTWISAATRTFDAAIGFRGYIPLPGSHPTGYALSLYDGPPSSRIWRMRRSRSAACRTFREVADTSTRSGSGRCRWLLEHGNPADAQQRSTLPVVRDCRRTTPARPGPLAAWLRDESLGRPVDDRTRRSASGA